MIDLLAGRAHEKRIELRTLVAEDLPETVRGDSGRIRQILINLIGNSIKFTDRGRATVRVTPAAVNELRGCRAPTRWPR